ncbi:MAG TPA: hypothetical protein VM053_00280, partial [Gemmatimonadaceae bacterium]|nr:hypothetical protein [Gemmatimonadaceae bacterium]
HKYLPFGPLPAILLVPFLWLLNAGVPLVVLGYVLTTANVALFLPICRRLGNPAAHSAWLSLLYFGGTVYLPVALVGISTFFAHIVATTFLLLAILEILGKRRMLLAGLFLGLAATARMSVAFTLPFFIWLAIEPVLPADQRTGQKFRQSRIANTAVLLLGVAIPVGLYLWYNFARFGNALESGFALAALYTPALEEARSVGLFSLAHVPKNLFNMLVALPSAVRSSGSGALEFPYLKPSPWGMGVFFCSPALLYLFRAPLRDRLVQACWVGIACTLTPILAYYGIGFVQFGYRYALDFMPLIILLVARGTSGKTTPAFKALTTASVLINIWGAVYLAVWL